MHLHNRDWFSLGVTAFLFVVIGTSEAFFYGLGSLAYALMVPRHECN